MVRAARLEPAREFLQSEPLGADKWGPVFLNKEQAGPAFPLPAKRKALDPRLNPVSVALALWLSFSLFISRSRIRGAPDLFRVKAEAWQFCQVGWLHRALVAVSWASHSLAFPLLTL